MHYAVVSTASTAFRAWRLLLFGGICLLLFTSCVGVSRAPTEPVGVRILRDWTFATADNQPLQLDLYLPEHYGQPLPIIIWLHGGGWMFGTRARCPLASWALRGYALASVSYRTSDITAPIIFPAQLHDCKAAVRWLRVNAWRFGCDGERIGVVGVSAGAHLAALLGTTANDAALEGDLGETGMSSQIQAVAALFPPTDLLALEQQDPHDMNVALMDFALLDGRPSERPALARSASPALQADRTSAPFLIAHGRDDGMIPYQQSELLHEALRNAGASSILMLFDHLPHSDEALDQQELQGAMQTFFADKLHPPMIDEK